MNNSTAKAKPKMTVKNGVVYGDALSAQEKKRIVMQKKKDRKAKKVRKSAQQTIPYVEMCRDGIQCVADMRTQDVKAIREFGKFVPAFAAFEKNRLSLYREAAKEAEEIFDRWTDEIDDLDEDYEPDEFFSD